MLARKLLLIFSIALLLGCVEEQRPNVTIRAELPQMDVGGEDLQDVPRFPNSTRFLFIRSGDVYDIGYHVRGCVMDDVTEFYENVGGWSVREKRVEESNVSVPFIGVVHSNNSVKILMEKELCLLEISLSCIMLEENYTVIEIVRSCVDLYGRTKEIIPSPEFSGYESILRKALQRSVGDVKLAGLHEHNGSIFFSYVSKNPVNEESFDRIVNELKEENFTLLHRMNAGGVCSADLLNDSNELRVIVDLNESVWISAIWVRST